MDEIDLSGPDAATGVWALEDYNLWEDGTQNHGWGHYLETYVKRSGCWYIQTMALFCAGLNPARRYRPPARGSLSLTRRPPRSSLSVSSTVPS